MRQTCLLLDILGPLDLTLEMGVFTWLKTWDGRLLLILAYNRQVSKKLKNERLPQKVPELQNLSEDLICG